MNKIHEIFFGIMILFVTVVLFFCLAFFSNPIEKINYTCNIIGCGYLGGPDYQNCKCVSASRTID